MTKKEKYMQRAIELAKMGMGYTSPNPMVGCVVVKDDEIISEGYHERYGEYHAERNALMRCRQDTAGAQLYVTLEPCCHHGKTPPCTDIIIEKGIAEVYIGSLDPNPLVDGGGIKVLKEHGIKVKSGICKKECDELNEVFFHYIKSGMPFVALKYAMTLDGKIACANGDSKWITSENARAHVHKLRKQYTGIMVGIGTVLKDDPMLNCRIEKGVDPVRIICDSHLRIPPDSQIVKSAKNIKTYVFATDERMENLKKAKQLEAKKVNVVWQTARDRVDLDDALRYLGKEGIDSILVEGGSTLNSSLIEQGLIQKVYAYIAPKIVGGKNAPGPVGGIGVVKMSDALKLTNISMMQIGCDYIVEGSVDSFCSQE